MPFSNEPFGVTSAERLGGISMICGPLKVKTPRSIGAGAALSVTLVSELRLPPKRRSSKSLSKIMTLRFFSGLNNGAGRGSTRSLKALT
jgi:hypothetical protein